jgi:hypothetical protein
MARIYECKNPMLIARKPIRAFADMVQAEIQRHLLNLAFHFA